MLGQADSQISTHQRPISCSTHLPHPKCSWEFVFFSIMAVSLQLWRVEADQTLPASSSVISRPRRVHRCCNTCVTCSSALAGAACSSICVACSSASAGAACSLLQSAGCIQHLCWLNNRRRLLINLRGRVPPLCFCKLSCIKINTSVSVRFCLWRLYQLEPQV